MKVLIIKAGSAGDVLRTTPILRTFRDKYPGVLITWVVEEKNLAVLAGNPLIDVILPLNAATSADLSTVKFDIAVNLDVTPESSALMSAVQAGSKKGFALDAKGVIFPVNEAAIPWHRMGLSDELKKSNRETYHDIIHDICGFKRNKIRPILKLGEKDLEQAKALARSLGLDAGKPVIGVNIGGSGRWKLKSPADVKWAEIIDKIADRVDGRILLLGGPKEKEKYKKVLSACKARVAGCGTDHPFAVFAAMIGLCDVLVTPDTLALHVGTALDKKIVAIFGPTSSAEIELYGKGRKICPAMECLCCYRKSCEKAPSCMDKLDAGEIAAAVKELLSE